MRRGETCFFFFYLNPPPIPVANVEQTNTQGVFSSLYDRPRIAYPVLHSYIRIAYLARRYK